MNYMTYPQLKASARARLAPVINSFVGATAIFYGLTLLVRQFSSVSSFLIESFALEMMLLILFSVLSGIFNNMLTIGYHYLMLSLYCGRPFSVGDIFYAFSNRTKTALGLSTIMSLMNIIPLIPFYIFFGRYSTSLENMDFIIAMFCYTPALVLTTILKLMYAQANYMILDFPSFSVKQLLKNSRLLMHGHKGRLFYTRVCMLPILLPGSLLTCGIGLLWLMPFACGVRTEFYLDLVTKRRRAEG